MRLGKFSYVFVIITQYETGTLDAVRGPQTNFEGLDMKFIIAIIKPHRLDPVRDALSDIGINGLTVTEVQGYGRQRGQKEIYRGAEYEVHFLPKVKLEIAVDDDLTAQAVEVLQQTAHTGQIGDGKIFVLDLTEVVRIRTGETGTAAL